MILSSHHLFAENGSVIVIQTKGLVEAFSPTGKKLTEPVVRGCVLPVGYALKTGMFSESVLLFSNGTTATLQEKSKLRLDKFFQKPFEAKGNSFGQLAAEPSTSEVSLDMEIGSLVVQTKKLNKSSSFSISTPTGTAGIRGTQFQMAMSPGTGMKLDVAESQVAFTPAGQAQPVVVGPGKGLDASPSGALNQRPINPSVAQNINVKNASANSASSAVPVATAKQAITKSGSSSSSDSSDEASEDSEDSDSDEEAEQESESDESDDSSDAADSFIEQSANSIREVSGQETSATYLEKILSLIESTPEETTQADTVSSTPPPSSNVPGFRPDPPSDDFKLSFNQNNEVELIILDFFDSPLGSPISLDSLSHDEIDDLLSSWISGDFNYASLALESFIKHATTTNYGNDNVNDAFRMAWFITSLFFHDLTGDYEISGNHVLTEANWDDIVQGNITPGAVLNAADLITEYGSSAYLYDLGIALIGENVLGTSVTESGIATGLLDEFIGSDGKGVPDFFTLGKFSDGSSNYLLNSVLLGASHNDLLDALDSDEKQRELSQFYKIYAQNINGVLGQEMHIGSPDKDTVVNVGQWLQKATNFESDSTTNPSNDKKLFVFAAGKDLHLAGDVRFENSHNGVVNKTEDHALVLGSAENVVLGSFENGSTADSSLYFEGSNLGIGSYEDLTVVDIEIDVGGNLALGTLGTLNISTTDISVGRHSDRDNVYMYAEDLLLADTLTFSDRARVIYMEAKTVDLKNVHFPADSQVMLRSQNGTPFFYGENTSNPNSSWQPLHVNFYSDSNTYGGSKITEGEFIQKTHGEPGYNSRTFKTGAGDPAIKIRAFPDK